MWKKPTAPSQKSDTSTGLTKVGRGDTLKLHLRRTAQGEGWSLETKDSGPRVGHPSPATPETKPQEGGRVDRPYRSPLTSKLLAPNEQLTDVLDYEDVDEYEPGMPDPEIAQAVAHIPQPDAFADVEMQESRPTPRVLNPKSARSGMTLIWSDRPSTELGSTSPVMARENQMLDGADGATSRDTWSWSAGAPMRTPVVPTVTKSLGFFLPGEIIISMKTSYSPVLD